MLLDCGGSFSLSLATLEVNESPSSGPTATATVTLSLNGSNCGSGYATVIYNTAGGTASSGSDYTAVSVTATLGPTTTTSMPISVAIVNDSLDEALETFTLSLTTPSGDTILADGSSTTTISIVDDDTAPQIRMGTAHSAVEGDSSSATLNIPLTLHPPTGTATVAGQTITVNYTIAAGSAATPADFSGTLSGVATFNPGASVANIPVLIMGDAVDEMDESFVITLSSPTNATLDSVTTSLVTIIDNEGTNPIMSATGGRMDEAQMLQNQCEECGSTSLYLTSVNTYTASYYLNTSYLFYSEYSTSSVDISAFVLPVYESSTMGMVTLDTYYELPDTEMAPVPSQYSVSVTLKDATGTSAIMTLPTVYYSTEGAFLSSGDELVFSVQIDPSLTPVTGYYTYETIITSHYESTVTSSRSTGSAIIVNRRDSPYGAGWWMPGMDQVIRYENLGMALIRADGSTAWFPYDDTAGDITTYTASSPGYYVKAEANTDTDLVTLTTKYNEVFEFDIVTGRLWFSYDPAGNKTTFDYGVGGVLDYIQDPFGRRSEYAYDSGKLDTVTDFAERVVDVDISGGKLELMTFPDPGPGSAPQFAYGYYSNPSVRYDGLLHTIDIDVQHASYPTDTAERRMELFYDGAGLLNTVRNPDYSATHLSRWQITSADAVKLDYLVVGSGDGLSSGNPTPVRRLNFVSGSVTDELGATTYHRFNAERVVYSIQRSGADVETTHTGFHRDANGLIDYIEETDPDGVGPLTGPVTSFTYDSYGNVETQTNPDGSVQTWAYDAHGPSGSPKFGLPVSHVDEEGRQTLFDVDSATGLIEKVTRVVEGSGGNDDVVTSFAYTAGSSGTPDDYDYLPVGLLLKVTEDIGGFSDDTVVETVYDYYFNPANLYEVGRLKTITRDAANGTPSLRIVESYEYDNYGILKAYTDGLGHRTELTNDSLGRLVEIAQPYPDPSEYDEAADPIIDDADGSPGFVKSVGGWDDESGGYQQTYWYLDDGEGGYAEWEFEGLVSGTTYEVFATWPGRPGDGAQYAQFSTSGEIDDLSDTVDQRDDSADQGPFTDMTFWESLGTVIVDGNSFTVRLHQNATGTVVADAVRIVQARPKTTMTYNVAGDLLKLTDPLGRATQYVYDLMSRPIQVTQPDPGSGAPVSKVTYDTAGNIRTATNPVGAVTGYQYDSFGRMTKALAPYPSAEGGLTLDDVSASPTGTGWTTEGTGKKAWAGDGSNKMTWTFAVTQDQPYEVLIQWTGHGSNSEASPFTVYDGDTDADDPWPTVDINQKVNPPPVAVLDGNWLSLGTYTPTSGHLTIQLTDEAVGRVIADTVRLEPRSVTTFTYDKADNVDKMTDTLGNETDYNYDLRHRLIKITEPSADGIEATPITEFVYNKDSQLRHVIDPLGRTARYTYDKWLGWLQDTRAPHLSATAIDIEDEDEATLTPGTLGVWSSGSVSGALGSDQAASTNASARAEWSLAATAETAYEVFATWKAAGGQATAAPTSLISGGTTISSTINQSQAPRDGDLFDDGTLWESLGVITVPIGEDEIIVRFDAQSGKTLVADAVRLMPKVSTTAHTYDQAGNIQTVTDPRGMVTDFDYDNFHRLIMRTDPDPGANDRPVTEYVYDNAHNLISLEDPEDNVTDFKYDALNRLVEEKITLTGPVYLTRTYSYDAVGNVLRYKDRNDRKTDFVFDALYRLTSENWLDDMGAVDREITYGYDVASRLTAAADAEVDSQYTYVYNALGQVKQANSDNFNHTASLASEYDVNGRRTTLASTLGSYKDFKNTYGYDNLNRLTQLFQQQQASGSYNLVDDKAVVFKYDLAGQFDTITRHTDLTPSSDDDVVESTFEFDQMGRLTGLLHEDDTASTIVDYSWEFDPASRIKQFVADDGTPVTTDYDYDDTNQLLEEDDGSPITYAYDENGNRTGGYSTDLYNRITSSPTHTFAYDNEGNQTIRTNKDNGTRELMEWDHRNRLTSITTEIPREVAHWKFEGNVENATGDSDLDGLLVNTPTYGNTDRVRDEVGNQYLELDGIDQYVSLGADDEFTIRNRAFFSISAWFQVVDDGTYMTIIDQGNAPNGGGSGYRIAYHGDGLPHPTIEFLLNDGVNQGGSADRLLLSEQIPGGLGDGEWHHMAVTITNSASGAVKLYLDGAEVDSKSNTQDGDIAGGDLQFGNQGGVTPGYFERYLDDIRIWHEWLDPADITALYTSSLPLYETSKAVAYDYDPFDRRIRKQIDNGGDGVDETHEYVYDGEDIVLALDGSGSLKNRYLHGPAVDMILADEQYGASGSHDQPASEVGIVYWPLTDHLGSVRYLVENDGDVAKTIEYDAFGQMTADHAEIDHIYGFTGREHDKESHLQFNRARYYDAAIGRWISEDPIGFSGGDGNLSRYVGNVPTVYYDPSGRMGVAIPKTGTPENRLGKPGSVTGTYGPPLPDDYKHPRHRRPIFDEAYPKPYTTDDGQQLHIPNNEYNNVVGLVDDHHQDSTNTEKVVDEGMLRKGLKSSEDYYRTLKAFDKYSIDILIIHGHSAGVYTNITDWLDAECPLRDMLVSRIRKGGVLVVFSCQAGEGENYDKWVAFAKRHGIWVVAPHGACNGESYRITQDPNGKWHVISPYDD